MIVTRSASETEALASHLAARLRAGDVVALRGELGAGKTTFVRGVLRGLGYAGRVASPTYSLAARYEIANNSGGDPTVVYHLDAYFSQKERDFLAEGGAELIGGDAIALVEWPERMAEFLPAERLEITLSEGGGESDRNVEFYGCGERGEALAAGLSILSFSSHAPEAVV